MIVIDDSVARYGWALKDPRTGVINLAEICEEEEDAHALNRAMKVHQPRRGNWKVCRIVITVGAQP
jgi:hypothetical protein